MGIEDDPTPFFGSLSSQGRTVKLAEGAQEQMQHGNPYVSGIFRDPQ